jgi:hypothetical protein
MRHLSLDVAVAAPLAVTLEFLGTYFEQPVHVLELAKVWLRSPLRVALDGMPIDKPVAIEFRNITNDRERLGIEVSWSVQGSPAFLRYCGTFAAGSLGYDRSWLSLVGRYPASGNIAGSELDEVTGNRIVRATLVALLKQVAVATAEDFAIRAPLPSILGLP